MVLLRTSYMYGDFLEYYFRLQFGAFWSMHDKTHQIAQVTRNLGSICCNTPKIVRSNTLSIIFI